MHKDSVRNWVQGEQLLKQLLLAGVPRETLVAIVNQLDFAEDVAQAINTLYVDYAQLDGAEERRVTLSTLLSECSELRTSARNVLSRALGIRTVGDLALATEDEIKWERGIGGVGMMSIHKTLNVRGLGLRGENEDKFERAIQLYGGRDYVPPALKQFVHNN